MPDGPYLTPEEESLARMLHESGSPAAAGQDLLRRLEALEAVAAALEAAEQADQEANPDTPNANTSAPAKEGDAP